MTSRPSASFVHVDAEEYEATPIGRVARGWAAQLSSTINFNNLVREGMNILVPNLEAKNILAGILQTATNAQRIDWHNTSARTQNEIAADFRTLNGLILMAAWGGFESFVEDFCRAALMMDRSLLESPSLKGIKISP